MENEQTPEEIQQQLATLRFRLMKDVSDVQATARRMVDWRHHFREHPLLFCGVAAAIGYLLVPRVRPVRAIISQVASPRRELLEEVAFRSVQPARWRPLVGTIAGLAVDVLAREATALARHGSRELLHRFMQRAERRSAERRDEVREKTGVGHDPSSRE